MKAIHYLLLTMAMFPLISMAQSSTTEKLQQQYPNALNLFFYHNTLRMINQQENEAFDDFIKDIEKMRFLLIKKSEHLFNAQAYADLVADYQAEHFEPIMTARHEGRNFDVYLKDAGKSKGMLVLVNDAESLWILDILGTIAPDKVGSFLSTLDKNTDISQKISEFID